MKSIQVGKHSMMGKAVLAGALACMGVLAGCVASGHEGSYREADGAVTLELKAGKASMNIGQIHIEGPYSEDGGKVTIHPEPGETQPMVLTVNQDGSLQGPEGSVIGKLDKAK
jgi:hypothetical protein